MARAGERWGEKVTLTETANDCVYKMKVWKEWSIAHNLEHSFIGGTTELGIFAEEKLVDKNINPVLFYCQPVVILKERQLKSWAVIQLQTNFIIW